MNVGRSAGVQQLVKDGTVNEAAGLRVVVPRSTVLRRLIPLMVVIGVASMIGQLVRLWRSPDGAVGFLITMADVDAERTYPTWFQVVVLGLASAALWTVAKQVRMHGLPGHVAWRLLAAVFLYLSADEGLRLHDRARGPLSRLNLGGVLYFSWVLVAVPLLVVLGVVLLPWLRALPRPTLTRFMIAGAVYVGGAVGLEMIGGALYESGSGDSLPYVLGATLEETMEMVGVALLFLGVADFRRRVLGAAHHREQVLAPTS